MHDIDILTGGKYALKHVPKELRHILAAESAANDGLAYPFLSIAIYLTVEESGRVAFGKWFLIGWLCTSKSHSGVIYEEVVLIYESSSIPFCRPGSSRCHFRVTPGQVERTVLVHSIISFIFEHRLWVLFPHEILAPKRAH